MLRSIEGIYREGRIELLESPVGIGDMTRVIITFLESEPAINGIDLRERGIDEAKAADLLYRLNTFGEEWNSPEMDIYDDYDTPKSKL